jgi:hypothetical protein
MSLLAIAAHMALTAALLEPPVSLAWQAPETCPQREAIDARLHALLPDFGELATPDTPASLRVIGRIEPAGDRWTVTLVFESDRGTDERSFSGPDCVALADAAALVVAVAIDPLGVSQTIAYEEPTPEPEPEPTPKLPPAEPPPPTTTTYALPIDDAPPRDEPTARFAFALLGGGGYGPLRLAQAGVGVELGAFGPWWRASLRGLWLAPRRQSFAAGEARFDGVAIAVRGCGVPAVRRVEFPICAGVEAGSLRGAGTGTTLDARDANIPWVAVLVGPGLRWAVMDRIALGVDLELLAPLVRGGFTIDGTAVQQIAPVGVQALAGVELRLP